MLLNGSLTILHYHRLQKLIQSHKAAPPPFQMPISSRGFPGYPLLSLTWPQIGGTHNPFSGSVIFYNFSQNSGKYTTYVYLFNINAITKYTNESQMKRYHRLRSGRVLSTGAFVPVQLECTILPVFSPSWKLSEPYSSAIFTEASSQSHKWLLIQSPALPFSPEHEEYAESSKLRIMVWSWVTSPILKLSRSPPRVTSLEQKTSHHPGISKGFRNSVQDAPYHSHHSGNYMGFRSSTSGTRGRGQTCISYYITGWAIHHIKYIKLLLCSREMTRALWRPLQALCFIQIYHIFCSPINTYSHTHTNTDTHPFIPKFWSSNYYRFWVDDKLLKVPKHYLLGLQEETEFNT